MTPRRLICSPRYGLAANVPPLTIDGWENVTLCKPGDEIPTGNALLDHEPDPMPPLGYKEGRRTFRLQWAAMCRRAKPGDGAYGVDPSVHWGKRPTDPMLQFDDTPQMIANILRTNFGHVGFATDYYADYPALTTIDLYTKFANYRLYRGRAVQLITGVPSWQVFCAIGQTDKVKRYTEPTVLSTKLMGWQASTTDWSQSICLFAPAATPEAAKVVDEATRTLAGLIGGRK